MRDDIWNSPTWYAVQTKPQREKLAAARLRSFHIEVFFPRARYLCARDGGRGFGVKPLFPNYLFARFCASASLDTVRYSPGVNRIVCSGEMPVPIDAAAIEALQTEVGCDGFVLLAPETFRSGDCVRIQDGPFEGLVGRVLRELDDGKRVLLLIEVLREAQLQIERRLLALDR